MFFFEATHTSINAAQHDTSAVYAVDQQVTKRRQTTAQHGGSSAAASQVASPPPRQVCIGNVITVLSRMICFLTVSLLIESAVA